MKRRPHRSPLPALVAPLVAAALASPVAAQRPAISDATRAFVSVDAPVVALTHVELIDGTGAPARRDQTVVVRDGRIAAVGPAASTPVPSGAAVMDLSGRTVLPGWVMLHEHMFYPAGEGAYPEQSYSFPKLYLAGGATSVRTAGNMAGYADLTLAKWIDEGRVPGPRMDATAPYLEGPGMPIPALHPLTGVDDARRLVDYWAQEGATSYKAYMHITRAELGAAVEAAHARHLKVTGHLCSVTYREAADLGIDDLEHGFFASSDFVKDKAPDQCPGGGAQTASIADLDPHGPQATALIRYLVGKGVALTSTLTVFETFTPGRPIAPAGALEAMTPTAREQYLASWSRVQANPGSVYAKAFPNDMAMEKAFHDAGGLLVAGTDPTGFGGVVPGWSNAREVQLLVEAGFSPEEAVKVATLNGATYLGWQDRVGSVEAGKLADLTVVRGDPTADTSAFGSVEVVFKDGWGYDPAKLRAAARGSVGMR